MANKIGNLWCHLKARVVGYELFVNLICPMILLAVGFAHLFYGFLSGLPVAWISIVIVDAYVFMLMVLAALRMPGPIPERQVALVTIPALFLILVLSFAKLYIHNGHVARSQVLCAEDILKEPSDATYFSLVTITTLGYGDYAPQKQDARVLVIAELLSGALLLFFAFPVLGSRLAQFDEPTGTTIRRLPDDSWQVQQNNDCPQKYPKGNRLTLIVDAKGIIGAKVSD